MEVLRKCPSFNADEDTLVVFLLLNMDEQSDETKGILNAFRQTPDGDGVELQRKRGAVYPVDGAPSMCIAAARTINVKRGWLHCPIGMSKSDWLLWICKKYKHRPTPGDKHRRWFGIGVGFHALGMRVVHEYDRQASTCVCRPIPHFARLLYSTFKCSVGSTRDRGYFTEGIKELTEKVDDTEATESERSYCREELEEKKQLYERMLLYPLRLDDSIANVWVLDGVRMQTPSFASMVDCMVLDFIVVHNPLLVIDYDDVSEHIPARAPPLLEMLQSLHARLQRLEASDRNTAAPL